MLVVGDNGSGKSTLLATLAGLLPAQGGSIRIFGHDPLRERRKVHRRTGHLGHMDPFYPELDGVQNLMFQARLRGLGPDAVHAGIAAVDLERAARRPVGSYSHGMKRRLGLAKALLGDPDLVLLDEPESGLDAKGRTVFRDRLGRRGGRTVILSTHHHPDWLDWADLAWVLGGGALETVPLDGDKEERRRSVADALARSGGTTG